VREAILLHRVLERARDVRLPDKIVERLRAIFAGENFVTHRFNVNALSGRRKQKIKNLDRVNRIFLIGCRALNVERWTFSECSLTPHPNSGQVRRSFFISRPLVLASDGSGDREHFQSVEAAGRVEHPYSRRDEHFDIFLCRGLTADLSQFWPRTKNYH
jgi:hypothetical protein